MAASFVGLPVRCSLRDGLSIEGSVATVNAINGTISIQTQSGLCVLTRTDVTGLELLSVNKTGPGNTSGLATNASSSVSSVQSKPRHMQQPASHARDYHADVDNPSASDMSDVPTPITSKTKKRGGSSKGTIVDTFADTRSTSHPPKGARSNNKPQRLAESGPTVPAPASDQFQDEFDFGAGLRKFDKQREFEFIRSQDETDPALRLVSHNKRSQLQPKLLPNENVLTHDELERQQGELAASLALLDPSAPTGIPSHLEKATGRPGPGTTTLLTASGRPAPQVSLKQYREVLSIADIETGPNTIQRTENAGRGIASFVLSELGQTRGLSPFEPRKRPVVCVLCASNDKGSVALRAAAMLVNRGGRACALVGSTEGRSEQLKECLRMFSSSGGRVIRHLSDLDDQYDLVIDAISDSHDLTSEAIAAVRWVSSREIPVLSIDSAAGVDHDKGTPVTESAIDATYLLCRGAARKGAARTGAEVVVIDEGVPFSLWQRAGVDEDFSSMLGPDFVASLQRF